MVVYVINTEALTLEPITTESLSTTSTKTSFLPPYTHTERVNTYYAATGSIHHKGREKEKQRESVLME